MTQSAPPAILGLVEKLSDADCVIGSRWLPDSVMHQEQPTLRRVASRTFHFIVEMLFWMHIQDTQCPCKLLRPLRPLEGWIYKKLRAPQPLSAPASQK